MYLIGGDGYLNRYQYLNGINGLWVLGDSLYNSMPNLGACPVKV